MNKLFTLLLICILFVTSCGGSGGGTGGNGPPILPGPISDSMVYGTYTDAYTTVGVEQWIIQDSVSFLDSIGGSVQDFIGECNGKVYICFDGTSTGYYDFNNRTIHISADAEPLHRRLLHEYVHACHLDNKPNEDGWLLEVVAKGAEVYFGLWDKPESCDYSQIFNATDYTAQCSFACFLMEEYDNLTLWDIVHCGYTGVQAVEYVTGNNWDSIMEDWKDGK